MSITTNVHLARGWIVKARVSGSNTKWITFEDENQNEVTFFIPKGGDFANFALKVQVAIAGKD